MEKPIVDKTALQILSLEDSIQDFEIIHELLIDEGYNLKMDRVEREQEFVSALRNKKYDIVLADFNLPEYDAFEALKKSNEICPDIPFIVVSGIIGEVTAIELIKQGATDYVLKDKPERLPFAINRALRGVIEKEELRLAEEKLRESETHLRELNASKDKFFSIIAHDLKSPFNHILGFSNLLLEKIKEKDYDEIEKYAGIVQNSSQRTFDLLLNLMEWSKAQTGRMEFHPVTVDVDELINEITELLANAAQLKSITISTELPNNVNVLADKNMMGTILRNLISNAIKFTHPGGTIVISAEQKQNEWMICVSDSGLGIKKENLDKLFRIEESVSTKGTQQETGTGLGLILCKEFVDKHGGKIWAESQFGNLPAGPLRRNNSEASKAGGSQFYFTLPEINKFPQKSGD